MTSDEQRGKAALAYFHNEALEYPENYSMSLESLVSLLQKKSNGQFLDGLGFAITSVGMTESSVKRAMEDFARQAEGKLPERWPAFFSALQGEATKVNFIDALSYTAIESAKDIASGAQKVGDAVIKTGGILAGIGPFVIVGAILFIVAMRSKQLAGA